MVLLMVLAAIVSVLLVWGEVPL